MSLPPRVRTLAPAARGGAEAGARAVPEEAPVAFIYDGAPTP